LTGGNAFLRAHEGQGDVVCDGHLRSSVFNRFSARRCRAFPDGEYVPVQSLMTQPSQALDFGFQERVRDQRRAQCRTHVAAAQRDGSVHLGLKAGRCARLGRFTDETFLFMFRVSPLVLRRRSSLNTTSRNRIFLGRSIVNGLSRTPKKHS
jgi:hypothetical protein